jgi:hypothetical protein
MRMFTLKRHFTSSLALTKEATLRTMIVLAKAVLRR